MSKNSVNNSGSNIHISNIVVQCFKSSVFAYLIFVFLTGIFAYISLNSDIIKKNIFIIEVLILTISSLVCGYICAGNLKIKGLISGCLSAVFLMILVYVTLAVASSMTFTNKCLIVVPVTLIFSIIGAIIYKNTRHRK